MCLGGCRKVYQPEAAGLQGDYNLGLRLSGQAPLGSLMPVLPTAGLFRKPLPPNASGNVPLALPTEMLSIMLA